MITSGFIKQLRRQFHDNPELHQDSIVGDGSSTVYQAKFAPIKEGSSELSINNVIKTENTDYTLDYDTGDIELTNATSNTISHVYNSVKFRDADWLNAIQAGHQAMGDQFFKTVVMDTSSMQISGGSQIINCPANCIRVLQLFESNNFSASPTQWVPLRTNWRYDRRSNKITTSVKPTRNNYVAATYLRKIVAPSSVSMPLDVEENWEAILTAKAGEEFFRSMANKIAQQGNATVEEGHLNVQALRVMANDYAAEFESLRKRLKPVMPNLGLPFNDSSKGLTP